MHVVEHAAQIQYCFRDGEKTLGLAEIAAVLELNESSVYKLLETLVSGGLLAKDTFSRGYTLGIKVVQLAQRLGARFALTETAMPLIERLRDQTGETAALHVRIGTVRLCVGQLPSPQPVRLMLETNHPYPLVCGAASKAFLAYLPAASLEDLVSQLPASAGQALMRELPAIRKQEFAVSCSEVLAHTTSICAAVLSRSGLPLPTIGIHGLAYHITESAIPDVGKRVVAIAKELSDKLAP